MELFELKLPEPTFQLKYWMKEDPEIYIAIGAKALKNALALFGDDRIKISRYMANFEVMVNYGYYKIEIIDSGDIIRWVERAWSVIEGRYKAVPEMTRNELGLLEDLSDYILKGN